jgi:hypothetical protein
MSICGRDGNSGDYVRPLGDAELGKLVSGGELMPYKDVQQEAVSYFPENFEEAEAALMIEHWEKKSPGEDLWFVFATCMLPEQTLRFVYPIDAPPSTPVTDIVRFAQEQHEHFQRPPVDGRVRVVHVTPQLIASMLPQTNSQGPTGGVCDFCCNNVAARMYDAEDFVMCSGRLSVGAWAACSNCAGFVDERNKEALALRMAAVGGVDSDHERELMRRQVNDFFAHRKLNVATVPAEGGAK